MNGPMADSTKAALDSVRTLMLERRYDAACEVLREAREVVRAEGNKSDESFLTSMLVSHLSVAGQDEKALEEALKAETAQPNDREFKMLTMRQLLRTGRKSEAAARCEGLLNDGASKNAEERHMLVSSLGECVADGDAAQAQQRLREALEIAVAGNLEPIMWNRTLAIKLARLGRVYGNEYLRRLRSVAVESDDEATVLEVDAFLSGGDG
jgi:predicted Zn-dependent protease